MYPDYQQLSAFVTVAQWGSFTKASEQLFLTQPAVSKRILALEENLNCRLFDRIGRQIVLTEAGKLLLPRAKVILKKLQESRRVIDELRGQVAGELALASSHHIALYHLPKILRQYNDEYPLVDLRLCFLDSEQACQKVLHGELELALVSLPEDQQLTDLIKIKLWQDPLHLVVGLSHPLGLESDLDLATLLEYPAILPPEGSVTRKLIHQQLNIEHSHIQIKLSSTYLETIKSLVIAGLAWSVLPKTMLCNDLRVLWPKQQLNRQLGVVYHRNRSLSNAAKALLALIETCK